MNLLLPFIALLAGFTIGFLWGRYVFFVKGGAGIVRQVKFQPQRTISARDVKADTVYKMMASQLLKNGTVEVKSKDIEKTMRRVAKLSRLKYETLTFEKVSEGNFKIIK